MKFNKIVSLFLVIFFIFGLSGCTNPLPQHSKGQLKSYATENYGNIDKVVSFEDERDKNILVIQDKLGFTYEVESKSYETFIDGTSFGYSFASISDNYIEKYYEYLFNTDEMQRFLEKYNLGIITISEYGVEFSDSNLCYNAKLIEEYIEEIYNVINKLDRYNLFDVNIKIKQGCVTLIDYDYKLDKEYQEVKDNEVYKNLSKEEVKYKMQQDKLNNSMIEYIKKGYGTCDYLGEKEIDPKESPALYAMLEDAINNYAGNEKYSSMLESCPVYYFRNYHGTDYIYFYVVKSEFTMPSYIISDFVPKYCEYYQEELNKFAEELGGTTCRYEWSQESMKLDLYIDNGLDRFDLDLNELKKLRYVEDSVEDLLRIENARVLNNLNIMIYYE